jgi:diguanylate cyclase (GGDEF)-like protein
MRLDELAFIDGLTGLPNRVLLFDRLRLALASAARHDRPFTVHFLDLDGFKEVNDSFGRAAGDEVLREVGRRLAGAVREIDTAARLGGDEFVVVQAEIERPKDAERLAARLRSTFEAPIVFGDRRLIIGTSIGTREYPRDRCDAQALLAWADEALHRAKERRRKAGAPGDVTFIERGRLSGAPDSALRAKST